MDVNLTKLLDTAYNLHISGKLSEAKGLYEQILKAEPENLDALNLYAQLLVALKSYDDALSIFFKIDEKIKLPDIKLSIAKVYFFKNDFKHVTEVLNSLENKPVEVLNLLATAYIKLNDYEQAYFVYKSLINTDNNFVNNYNISFCLGFLKKYDEAYEYALRAYEMNPKDIPVIMQCANYSEKLNKYDDAIKYLKEAEKLSPSPELYNKLGSLYAGINNQSEALSCYKTAIQLDNKNKQAMLNIAYLYKTIDKNVSINILTELLQDYPEDKIVISSLYYMFYNMVDYNNAIKYGLYYIDKFPDDYFAYEITGEAYYENYDYTSALNMYKKADELSDNENIKIRYAKLLYLTGDIEKGKKLLQSYKNSDNAKKALINISLAEKNLKDCEEAFFDWQTSINPEKIAEDKARRFFYKLNINNLYNVNEDTFVKNVKSSENHSTEVKLSKILKRIWRRENIQDKTLLLFSYNGIGDMLMFSRYINILKNMCKKIIMHVPSALYDLMKYNFPYIDYYQNLDDIKDDMYDYSASFFTILYSLDVDLKNIPYSKGYLSVKDDLIIEKSKDNLLKTDKKKAGIYWQGNPTILLNRSVKLKYFEPLFNLDKIQLYSFQMSDIDKESDELKKSKPIIDLAPMIKSYEDTAVFLKNMDVLVTIDTSIANLAGALGVKTYLMLPKTTDWRWFNDNDTTPWYDSVKIFRADKDLVWDDVIVRIKDDLSKV